MMNQKKNRLLYLLLTAVCAGLYIALDRATSIYLLMGMKIGVAFVPILFLAVLCGPVYAAFAWGIADMIGALVWPVGVYHPGFTAIAFLMGWVFGLFLYQDKLRWWQVILPTAINFVILGPFVNTVWVAQLYFSKTYWGWFFWRIPEYLILIALSLILIPILFRVGLLLRKRLRN